MKESAIQAKIIKYLKSIGCYVFKVSIANRAGIPDIIGCFKGKFFAIEVKAEHKQATALQEYNINEIKKAGGQAMVARTLEEVKEYFERERAFGFWLES